MSTQKTIKFGGKAVILTLNKIDPRNGVQYWIGDNGVGYLYYDGRYHRAVLTAK